MEAILRSVNEVKLNYIEKIGELVDRHPFVSFITAVVAVPVLMILAVGMISSAVVLPLLALAAL